MKIWDEVAILDNGDGTGWRVDRLGWAYPLIETADGFRETDGTPVPPDCTCLTAAPCPERHMP